MVYVQLMVTTRRTREPGGVAMWAMVVKSQALYLYNAANQGTRQVAMAMWAVVEKITSRARGLEDFSLGTAKCRCSIYRT